jgi:hypothetical protein
VRRLLVLLLVAAAFPAAAPAATALHAGWKVHRSAAGGFTVATPSRWVDFTRKTPQVLEALRANPDLRIYVDAAKRADAVKLMVVDVSAEATSDGFATNLNVTQTPSFGSLDFQRKATVTQLESLGVVVGSVRTASVQLPAGRAAKLVYRADFGRGVPVVATTQFLLVRAGRTTVLTYTALPKLEARYRAVFDASARSLRFAA